MNRNICFLDLETTGVDVQTDRIVEICIIKLNPHFNLLEKRTRRVNPTIPIPKGASDVHGITDEMVKNEPTFKELAKGIHDFIQGCDIAGFNSNNYDNPLLYNELERAGIAWDYKGTRFIDVCNIFKIKEERTLSAAVKFYTGEEHTDAHGAESDVLATIKVFSKQIEKHGLADMSIDQLALFSNYDRPILDISGKFSTDADGDIIFNFGKHKGKKAKTERGYLDWMLKGNFNSDTKAIIKTI